MLLQIITSRNDGCFVKLEEKGDKLHVQLLSHFDIKEVVDQREVDPKDLLGLLELWESW